jgi:ABC-type thiamine transport system ATPase subunit|tara:strand:- start:3191 stop:3550 length:360 start_codon:yes stop_codon:yes gene_type:complete
MSTKDNSGKACIHLTQAQKISALKAVGVEPRKGSAPALIRALPKWAKAHKEASAELGVFVAAEMPATMSSGQKAARAVARQENPAQVIAEMLQALPPELRKIAQEQISKTALDSDTKTD